VTVAGSKGRERAKRLIAELTKMTEENGCSEQEALNAAARIGQLLQEYDLTMDEATVREDAAACRENEVYAADDYAGTLISGIGKFCTLIVYQRTGDGHGCKYVMFGTPHDLELGMFLYEVCAEAMEHDWAIYMEKHGYSMKKRQSFRMGFSGRVYQRLMQMKAERDARNASDCRSLVVLKDQLVSSEWNKKGIKLRKAARTVAADEHAYAHGQAAGSRVNLNNPLGGGSQDGGRLR
jgi:hypothetical protein